MNSETHTTKVGVVGAGWWATFAHIPALQSHSQAEVIAVQSRDQAKADKIARDFKIRHAFTGVDELLDAPGLEAVVISSTPNMHYSQAKAALERGMHLLLEKPMTFTAAEARELVDLAASKNVQLLISCPWHFTAHAIEARKLIAAGELGRIKMISILMTNPIDKLLRGINSSPTFGMDQVYVEPRIGSYNDPAIAGGGQIYCQVSHTAAYITFLTGLRPAEVFARFDYDGTVNDIYDALIIRMENGALVSLASTAATPLSNRAYEVRIYGEKGVMMLELWQGTMSISDFEGQTREFPPVDPDLCYPARSPALNFIDAVRGNAPNGSPGELGLASMEIIEAACQSANGAGNVILRPIS